MTVRIRHDVVEVDGRSVCRLGLAFEPFEVRVPVKLAELLGKPGLYRELAREYLEDLIIGRCVEALRPKLEDLARELEDGAGETAGEKGTKTR